MNEFEEWRVIDGFPNYSVSSYGRVMNNKTERIMQPFMKGNGYLTVNIIDIYGVRHSKYVHRLVALAFIDSNPRHDHKVCFVDNDHKHCQLDNLIFATDKEAKHKAFIYKGFRKKVPSTQQKQTL